MYTLLKTRLLKGVVTQPIACEIESLGTELREHIHRCFGRSFHIREVDTGSCGACESEIIATMNPVYDMQRFGINIVASPRHADALLVTGPVSKNMRHALECAYHAMPDPKYVITLGDCARNGGIFNNAYYVENGVNDILPCPIALHIPGCPPHPLHIIQHLLAFMKSNTTR